jgi:hypothetical protein
MASVNGCGGYDDRTHCDARYDAGTAHRRNPIVRRCPRRCLVRRIGRRHSETQGNRSARAQIHGSWRHCQAGHCDWDDCDLGRSPRCAVEPIVPVNYSALNLGHEGIRGSRCEGRGHLRDPRRIGQRRANGRPGTRCRGSGVELHHHPCEPSSGRRSHRCRQCHCRRSRNHRRARIERRRCRYTCNRDQSSDRRRTGVDG